MTATEKLAQLLEAQINDDAIWFDAKHITEAYLQHQLRLMHAAVEQYVLSVDDKYNRTLLGEV